MNSLSDIQNVLYINLTSRVDRKKQVEQELSKIGLKGTRFNAISLKNGAIGCSFSHLKCIQLAKENNWEHVLICEDDIQFLDPKLFINQLNSFLNTNEYWDVILISGNNIPPYEKTNDYSVRVTRCQTTTGYIVKRHYYDTLIDNYKKGIELLMKNPLQHRIYAIDKYWFRLQEKDNWHLITPLSVVQRAGFSNIEQRVTDFTKPMLDLDKNSYFQQLLSLKK